MLTFVRPSRHKGRKLPPPNPPTLHPNQTAYPTPLPPPPESIPPHPESPTLHLSHRLPSRLPCTSPTASRAAYPAPLPPPPESPTLHLSHHIPSRLPCTSPTAYQVHPTASRVAYPAPASRSSKTGRRLRTAKSLALPTRLPCTAARPVTKPPAWLRQPSPHRVTTHNTTLVPRKARRAQSLAGSRWEI
jgi:hypothetical protein